MVASATVLYQQAAARSATISSPIADAGSLLLHTGYLGSSWYSAPVTPRNQYDLLVVSVINDTWSDHVTGVYGGGAASWSPAGSPFYDGADSRIMQIWYGRAATTSASTLGIAWNGTPRDADVAVHEFAAGAGASWSLVTDGNSSSPFPSLSVPAGGGLYVGAAMAWSNGAAGKSPGVTYSVPNSRFLMAWDTGGIGTVAPSATGAGAVGAVFGAKSPITTTTTAATTTTTAATTTTTAAPSTTTHPTTTTRALATTTTVAPTTTTTGVPGPPASGVTDLAPPASLMPDSVFNSLVQGWAVDPNSSSFANDFVTDYKDNYGGVGVNTAPIYWVSATQSDSAVTVSAGCNNFTSDTGTELPIPSYTDLNSSSDNPLVIYQPSSASAWELWQATRNSNGTYSACWGGKLNLASTNGVFPSPYGLSATGIGYLPTTITQADVASGAIDHAIAVDLPGCYKFVYPANRYDCPSHPNDGPSQPNEGQWFRFPAGTAMPTGLTPFGQMVFKAVQTYGMVVTDYAGAVMLQAEQPSDWAAEGNTGTDPITASWAGQAEYQVVANLPWSQLQAVDPPH